MKDTAVQSAAGNSEPTESAAVNALRLVSALFLADKGMARLVGVSRSARISPGVPTDVALAIERVKNKTTAEISS